MPENPAQHGPTETIVVPFGGSFTYTPEPGLDVLAQFAWPVVAVVAVITLRKSIGAFIDRGLSFEGPGFKLKTKEPEQTLTTEPPEKPPVIVAPSASISVEPDSYDFEKLALKHDLEEARREIDGWRKSWLFERIFGELYGSQVRFLTFLASPPRKVPEQEVNAWFQHDTKSGEAQRSPWPWVTYLNRAQLIQVTAEDFASTSFYAIAPLGIEFLEYLKAQGLDKVEKPF
jgi:hypothetical protein